MGLRVGKAERSVGLRVGKAERSVGLRAGTCERPEVGRAERVFVSQIS